MVGSSISPFITPSPLVGEIGEPRIFLHDVHAGGDMAEGGEAKVVATLGRVGIERGLRDRSGASFMAR